MANKLIDLFFKKKKQLKTEAIKLVIEGAQVWMVSWNANAPWTETYSKKERKSRVFMSEEDAKLFKQSLIGAKSVLRDTDDPEIKIEKIE